MGLLFLLFASTIEIHLYSWEESANLTRLFQLTVILKKRGSLVSGVTMKLADFSSRLKYIDLPAEVVLEVKHLLLDSIGCAVAGLKTEKGEISLAFARRLGGEPESSIIGTDDKAPADTAAFVNGELFNALDYDALCSPSAHISPFVMAAPLALAEAGNVSGRDLITALAVSHEIAIRVARGLVTGGRFSVYIPEKEMRITGPTHGYGSSVFGGVAGAGRIMGFDSEKICHAFGIAGYMCPVPVTMRFAFAVPSSMSKYLSAGWISKTEVTAVMLAELGYTGDKEILDGEFGFWKSFASEEWRHEDVVDRLGSKWFLPESISYKAYPCCGAMHHALDFFYQIIEENDLDAADIERVDVLMNMLADFPLWQNRRIETHIEAQFSVAYVFAIAAHRVPIGPEWQKRETFEDPKILEFMDRVHVKTYADFQGAVGKPIVRVIAGKNGVDGKRTFSKGDIFTGQNILGREQLVDKFMGNVSDVVPEKEGEKAIETIFNLEELEDVSELLRLVR